jgi:hypothetical protein
MSRGIQQGTTAQSDKSSKLDTVIKTAAIRAFAQCNTVYPELTYQAKFTRDQIPGNIGSCAPDGGIWFYKGIPILASEAKYQAERGNAIERWYKNQYILRAVNPNISYVTFGSGLGVLPNNPIWSALHIAHLGGYNVIHPFKNSAFFCVGGFKFIDVANILIEVFNVTMKGLGYD